MQTLKTLLLLSLLLAAAESRKSTKFRIKSSIMSKENKQFVNNVIARYASVKHGFVLLFINEIHPDYGDYIASTVSNLNSSGYIINVHQDKDAALTIGEKHVKIAVVDPEGELNHIYHIFGRIKVARAKIVVVCTKKPHRLLRNIILASYRSIKCLNAIIVYQYLGETFVYTVNPFLPVDQSVVRLNTTDDFFYDKLKDMKGNEVNALFTYQDRTKANSKRSKGRTVYFGKDYDTFETIFKEMNASLRIVHLDDVLLDNETNPWINSNNHVNRLGVKNRIIQDYNISIVIHSQPFLIDDGITENTYPHTQDDYCILVPKGGELPLYYQLSTVFPKEVWLFFFFTCVGVTTIAVIVARLTNEKQLNLEELFTEVVRYTCLNNFKKYPRISMRNLIFFGWVTYCFLVNLFWQSQYTSILTKKSFVRDIDTIQELYDSGIDVYAFANQIEEIKKIYNGTSIYSDIEMRLKQLPEFTAFWELNRDVVYRMYVEEQTLRPFVITHDRAEFISRSKVYWRNGRPLLHLMRESIIPSYQCYQIQHGSPYLPTINRFLRYLQEGGILQFWVRRTAYRAESEGLLLREGYEESDYSGKIMDLNRSYPAFILLLIGHVIAGIVFAFEVIYKYLEDRRYNAKHPFIN